jgi:hypothetical protein
MRPPCGTAAGRAAHKRHHEPVCLDCAAAHADYIRGRRIATGASTTLYVPLNLATLLLRCAPPEVLAPAVRALGPLTVAALQRRHATAVGS